MRSSLRIMLVFLLCWGGAAAQVKKGAPAGAMQMTPAGAKGMGVGPKHLKISVIAKGYEDSVVIRWAPADPEAWATGNKSGYHLTRLDLSDGGHPVKTELGPSVILPLPERELTAGADTTTLRGRYRLAAAKLLYGNITSTSSIPATNFADRVKGQHSAFALRYMVAMMMADEDPATAGVLGWRWVDRQVKKGGKYVYVLTSISADRQYVMDSAAALVINIKGPEVPAPLGLEAIGYDRRIELRWNRHQSGYFSGYYVERSDDDGKTYRALTHAPYHSSYMPPTGDKKKDSLTVKSALVMRDHELFSDSVRQDYKTYYYRIRAINAFGELSSYSPPVAIAARDLTPPVPPVTDSARNIRGNEIRIWWTQRYPSPDLAGYYVDRGDSARGPFQTLSGRLLDKRTTSFTDTSALPHRSNFYVVVAVDTAGNASASIPVMAVLTDSLPPASPVGLTGVADSNGVVHLHWKRNTEEDVAGYHVFFSYDPSYHFTLISHGMIMDTSFTDTISTTALNRRIYYKVLAIDRNYNHSGYSAMATINKPVVIPPTPPTVGAVKVKAGVADIEWIESRSAWAAGYRVYRKGPDTSWRPIAMLKEDPRVRSLHFTDTTLRPNTDYLYAAETLDSTGIRSQLSLPVHLRYNARDLLPTPDHFQAVYDGGRHVIKLSWQYRDSGDYFFVIYRAAGTDALAAWKSLEKSDLSAEDQGLPGGRYQYAIKTVHRDRKMESALSPAIGVEMP